MAFIDRVGAAGRGVARGAVDYEQFMQSAANVNQLIANDKQRQLMQQMTIPQVGVQPQQYAGVELPDTRQLSGGVGLIKPPAMDPVGPGATWDQLQQFRGATAPAAGPSVGQNSATPNVSWQGLQDFRAGLAPGQVANSPFKDYYPNGKPFYEGPDNSVWGNISSGLGNFVYNLPGDLATGMMNSITGPYEMLGRPLFEPGYTGPHTVGAFTSDNSDVNVASAAPADAKAAPLTSQTAPASSGTPADAGGSSSGVGLTPKAEGAANPAVEEFFPRSVRNEMLQMSPEETGYIEQQIMQQRQEIARVANERISMINRQQAAAEAKTQREIETLRQYAQAAQTAGNVGLMTQYLEQADGLLAGIMDVQNQSEASALALQQDARFQIMDNDRKLWTQQAMRAEQDWIMRGDPTRLTQIMAAYGMPIAIEDAGNGKFRIVDITGDGEGERRKGTFSATDIADMFMSTLSDAFRQQKLAQQAERAKLLDERTFEMLKLDMQGAIDVTKAQIENAYKQGEYSFMELSNGDVVGVPKYPGQDRPIIYRREEAETNPAGVELNRNTREYY